MYVYTRMRVQGETLEHRREIGEWKTTGEATYKITYGIAT
jgi:hypothetical protein